MNESLSELGELICLELCVFNSCSVTELSSRTALPTWKVSRILKKLEIKKIVQHTVEEREKRGRPRKFYSLKNKNSQCLISGKGEALLAGGESEK